MKLPQWEYMGVEMAGALSPDALNEHGREGWELTHLMAAPGKFGGVSMFALFKRPVEPGQGQQWQECPTWRDGCHCIPVFSCQREKAKSPLALGVHPH